MAQVISYNQLHKSMIIVAIVCRTKCTFSAPNALTTCWEVKCFSHGHFRNVQVILAYISWCLLRNKLIELITIVGDFPCDLKLIWAHTKYFISKSRQFRICITIIQFNLFQFFIIVVKWWLVSDIVSHRKWRENASICFIGRVWWIGKKKPLEIDLVSLKVPVTKWFSHSLEAQAIKSACMWSDRAY